MQSATVQRQNRVLPHGLTAENDFPTRFEHSMTLGDRASFIDPHQEAIREDQVKKAICELQIMNVHFSDEDPTI